MIKEEERKRRLAEVEKKRWEEAKRKELYDLMKVNEYRDRKMNAIIYERIRRGRSCLLKTNTLMLPSYYLLHSFPLLFLKKEPEPEIEVIKEEEPEIKVNINITQITAILII